MASENLKEKLILGTVQFGLPYGINNQTGKRLSDKEIRKILIEASVQGIQLLDSAEAYGDALEKIGEYHYNSTTNFEVISKFVALKEGENIEDKVKFNLKKARLSHLNGYLFHNYRVYIENQFLLDELTKLQTQGLVLYRGISIYTINEFETVINDPRIDLIQLPFNLLDNFASKGHLMKRAKVNGKILHVRSVFLQGLFFKAYEAFPENLKPLIPELKKIDELRKAYSLSWGELALGYALSFSEIDGVLIGVDGWEHLKENLEFVLKAPLNSRLIEKLNNIRIENGVLLNPVNW